MRKGFIPARNLIQNQHLCIRQNSPSNIEHLSLPVAQHFLIECLIKSFAVFLVEDTAPKSNVNQSLGDTCVCEPAIGVHIVANSTGKEECFLSNASNPRSDGLARQRSNIYPVNLDCPFGRVQQPEECQDQG